jgi:gentisate 1,2-dioxygenase
MSAVPKHSNHAERQQFYGRIDKSSVAPLWEVLHGIITKEPKTPCVPYLWQWAQMRPWLIESAGLISAEEAERRVLILENPGLRGQQRVTHSLYAGLQLIMPGEVAPAHRHSQSALRFVLDGEGAYTAVEGEKVFMKPGDFILTPSWTWHDHGNVGKDPVIWLDGLDIAIVELLDAQFMERPEEQSQKTTKTMGESTALYGTNMLPVEYQSPSMSSPLFSYPYDRSRGALVELSKAQDAHPAFGWKLQYINPVTGGFVMPTIGTWLQMLPKGFQGKEYRSTDSTTFAVMEGRGTFKVGDEQFTYGPKDVFTVPSWRKYQLIANEESVLFSFSDRPVQKALGLWREQQPV